MMNVQPTSALAFRQAEESGQLNGKRYEVGKAFTTFGPGTSAEVLKAAKLDKNRNLMRARVTELADLGWLKQIGARKCNVTGRKAIVWAFERTEPRKNTKAPSTTKTELADYVKQLATVAEVYTNEIELHSQVDAFFTFDGQNAVKLREYIAEARAAVGIKS
jgi:hypothetical protein